MPALRRHGGGPGCQIGCGRREIGGGGAVAVGVVPTRRLGQTREVGGPPADPTAELGEFEDDCGDPFIAGRGPGARRPLTRGGVPRIAVRSNAVTPGVVS